MKEKSEKTSRGITLIALVITIIILLILAAVTIGALSGNNGILSNAAKAKQETEKAEILEQIRIDIYSEMADNLGEDPTDADIERIAGEYGKVEGNTFYDKVLTTTEGNYKIKLSEIWDSSTTLQPGEAATANRNKYESDGKTAVVPEGYTVSNKEGEMSIDDGLVIYSPNGDEYVWIPCTTDGANGTLQYRRETTKWTIENDNGTKATRDELTLLEDDVQYSSTDLANGVNEEVAQKIVNQVNAEKASIEKYSGFYIGRYEVGKENNEAVIQQNKEPYASIRWVDAYGLAQGIESGNNATSYLCSSYAYDTALSFIESKTESSDYGSNISKYNGNWKGKQVVDKNGNVIKEAGVAQRLNTGLTTALCNIYDMGGNVGEMTTELNPNLSETVVLRGHGYNGDLPAGYRWDSYSSSATAYYGFRATLFLI